MELKITPRTTELLQALPGVVPVNLPFPLDQIPGTPAAPVRNVWKPEKVAIIGTAPSSRMLAPFNDPTWTIWGSSPGNGMGAIPRFDGWIELHCNFLWPQYKSYGEPYVKWVNESTFPVLVPHLDIYKRMFPRAGSFPFAMLVEEFGRRFFTSTFAWMMAYAIHQGVKELALYGVDMSSRDEYIQQRAGGHYFIEMAERRGIKVTIPDESDLKQPAPLYGIADSTTFGCKMATREAEIRARIAQAQQAAAQAQGMLTYLNGALEDVDYMRNIWGALGSSE